MTTTTRSVGSAIMHAFHHFSTMPEKSADGSQACKYRKSEIATDPVRCAIGALIPDELYTQSMDSDAGAVHFWAREKKFWEIIGVEMPENPNTLRAAINILRFVQLCHDGTPADRFAADARGRARIYKECKAHRIGERFDAHIKTVRSDLLPVQTGDIIATFFVIADTRVNLVYDTVTACLEIFETNELK